MIMVLLRGVAYWLALVTVLLVSILAVQSSFTSPYASASHGDFIFSIEVTPKDAEVIPGGIATYDITVTRISGSFPTISLDLEDIAGSWDPAIKYWFEPSSGMPSFSSKLNIATSTSAGGVYGFKIDFKEEGHDSPFASEYITLRVGGEAFDFGIKAEPSYLKVAQGDSAHITVNVSLLKGKAQPVSLSPGDVLKDEFSQYTSAWFGVNAKPPPFSSVLTIVVSPDAPIGEHTLNIHGWWENVFHETPVTVIVEKKQATITEKEKVGGDLEQREKISKSGYISVSGNEFSLPSYKETAPVKISGNIDGYVRGTPIIIEVINPDGSVENFSIIGSKDGDYELQYYLRDTSQAGEYTVVVKYQNFWASISFNVVEKEEKKPVPTPTMPPQIQFDKERFSANDVGALIVISISDDLDPNKIESIKVKLWSSTDRNGLFLVLKETGSNTAVFITNFSLVTDRASSGNMIRVSPGGYITAEYGGSSITSSIEEKIVGKSGFNFIIYDKPLPPAPVGKYYKYSFCDPSPSSKLLCGGLIEQDINNPVGGVQPYTFQKETLLEIGGNIPFGLKLNPNGVLEGTPIKADAGKTFKFKVCAIDNTRSFVCDKTSLKVEISEVERKALPTKTTEPPEIEYQKYYYDICSEQLTFCLKQCGTYWRESDVAYCKEVDCPAKYDACIASLGPAYQVEEPLPPIEEPQEPIEESLPPTTLSGDIDSWTTKGGEEGAVCNPDIRPNNPCKKLSGPVQEGDVIKTGANNYAIIPLDNGRTQIWLGPDQNVKVLKLSEDERILLIFDLPYQMRAIINTPEGVKTIFAICSDKALEADDCSTLPILFWLLVTGTEFTLEQEQGEPPKLTVLQGEVKVWRVADEGVIVQAGTNEQVALEGDTSLATQRIDPASVDKWWVEASESKESEQTVSEPSSKGGGCLIATAAFGSELAPQVQMLRETRDNVVMQTQSGAVFMSGFNSVYYTFAPTVADWERENPVFKEIVKATVTPLITTLSILNYVDIDSEAEMLGYGIGIILLNIGMYFIAPAFVIMKLRRL